MRQAGLQLQMPLVSDSNNLLTILLDLNQYNLHAYGISKCLQTPLCPRILSEAKAGGVDMTRLAVAMSIFGMHTLSA